jgi:cytochrome c peroxidase
MNRRWSFVFSALLTLCVFLSQAVSGKLIFVKDIPNGGKNKCSTCHMAGQMPSKTTLNTFGMEYRDNGKIWNAAIAQKDSDGDGVSNGKELGDPDGTWKKGDADRPGTITNPGDPASK